jgi:serine/threonine protein kinase
MISPRKYHEYYLTRKIATGGMAEIFRAWKIGEAGFEKQVIIKRMLSHLTSNQDFLSMFLSEARLVSRLNHANIAQVYDLGKNQDEHEDHPTYFIAMEFVFGKNLAQIIKQARAQNHPLPWEFMAAVIHGAAQALEYAHELCDEQGRALHIVHRDISPQNILISYSGEVKLVDFGIAKALVNRQQTQTGVLKGKLSYMSPEQAMGESVDQRSDIYSLGIVLWEMLTRHRLFTANSEVGVLQKVIKPEVAEPTVFDPHIPQALAQACMRCLRSQREERYASAMELAKDLNAYLRSSGENTELSIRRHMHALFAQEMVSEKEQIQEEILAVREALADPGKNDGDATVAIRTDGALVFGQDDKPTTVLDPAASGGHTRQTSVTMTINAKIMRLANSLRTMTGRAMMLIAASLLLLVSLVAVVAMWPEETEQGLRHSASTSAAPGHADNIPAPQPAARTEPLSVPQAEISLPPTPQSSSPVGSVTVVDEPLSAPQAATRTEQPAPPAPASQTNARLPDGSAESLSPGPDAGSRTDKGADTVTGAGAGTDENKVTASAQKNALQPSPEQPASSPPPVAVVASKAMPTGPQAGTDSTSPAPTTAPNTAVADREQAPATPQTRPVGASSPAQSVPAQQDTAKPAARTGTSSAREAAAYNPLADPNLSQEPRQFDQERFDRFQSEFQQEQFAALEASPSSGALGANRIKQFSAPRFSANQAEVTIRIWKQYGSGMDVRIFVNGHPWAGGRAYAIGKKAIDVPLRLDSGENVIRLTHEGSSVVEGIQIQVGSAPAKGIALGAKNEDSVIVDY